MTNIFCFPHAGGFASHYFFLKNLEELDVKVHLYEYSGRGRNFGKPVYKDFLDCVNQTVQVVKKSCGSNFGFLGHSMGAYVAYYTSYFLEQEFSLYPKFVIVSGQVAPMHFLNRGISSLNDKELTAFIKSSDFTDECIFDNDELVHLLIPVIRNDYKIIEQYYPVKNAPKIHTHLYSFTGNSDPEITEESVGGWNEIASDYYGNIQFEGGHFYLFEQTKKVLSFIKKILREEDLA